MLLPDSHGVNLVCGYREGDEHKQVQQERQAKEKPIASQPEVLP